MATTYAGTKGRVRKVTTSPLSILGEGTWWLASRPGGVYLVGDRPTDYRTLRRIAADLRAIADTLNPEPRTEETA